MPESPKVDKPEPFDTRAELRKATDSLYRFIVHLQLNNHLMGDLTDTQREAFYACEGPVQRLHSAAFRDPEYQSEHRTDA